ncbi:major facilitator superfamily domain-containing protein [Geopyxis carbonaria]|nr:major facilitator superfamily domain-containing protein [Geopyxis carbonaria]
MARAQDNLDNDETRPLLAPSDTTTTSKQSPDDELPTSWLTLPNRSQLIVLAFCRFAEPLTQTSLLSYLYYFLKSFHDASSTPPTPATIARQAGIIASSFAASQCITGMLWGRLSDRIGRKPCILLGLIGTCLSVLGFGFSQNFTQALCFRIAGGCLNGNVGVLRTMMSETVREKRHQSRAFLIMPMCFNIGVIIGPALGGLLADPAESYPKLFGGVHWMQKWPYALPNIVSAVFLATSWTIGLLFLRETLESKAHRRDPGRELGDALRRFFRSRKTPGTPPQTTTTTPLLPKPSTATKKPRPSFRAIFTPNILLTLLSFTIIPLHNATFMHLYIIYLSTPRASPPPTFPHLRGGLGLPSHKVGLALSTLGFIGITFQLLLYPRLQARYGLMRSYQAATAVFPLAYVAAPLLVLLPPGAAAWAGIGGVLGLQVLARTFALPGNVILLTNAVENADVLGTVHGVGSSMASAARAVGPVTGAWAFAKGLEKGNVGWVYWGMAVVASVGVVVGRRVKEGKGIGI